MSKRSSIGSGAKNTLFNYFAKTPPAAKKAKESNEEECNSKQNDKKRELDDSKAQVDSDDDSPIVPRKKRIRLYPVDSDDSDTENKVANVEKKTATARLNDSFKYEKTVREEKNVERPITKQQPVQTPQKPEPMTSKPVSDDGNWVHCKLEFLKPDNIRDAKKRRPDDPDYDPRTLYVPDSFMKSQTPAHRQWWEMKKSHFDCVLFFKVGKFYELYHMDAAVGVNELGFSYMKGEFAHSGFPESAYARMASTLIAKGYKVARVEQTETPDMMQERCQTTGQNTKWDKVVRREICQVSCRGAEVLGLQDNGPAQEFARHITGIVEEVTSKSTKYGICCVDASVGTIWLGEFTDDRHSSRLRTLLAKLPPALVVYDKKSTSLRTTQIINSYGGQVRKEPINNMWSAEKTLKILNEKYFQNEDVCSWPEELKMFLDEDDHLRLTPAKDSALSIKALGGCLSFLTDCLLDIQVMGMAQFKRYLTNDVTCALDISLSQRSSTNSEERNQKWDGANTMVLDAVTLKNLRIIECEGSLYDKLNFCLTAMGKRLLFQWVCSPSCLIDVIAERQEAIQYLLDNYQILEEAKNVLRNLPDMDRLLAKINTLGNLKRSQQHPDSRAIFYEEKQYSKKKVKDFLALISGFERIQQLAALLENSDSRLLRILCSKSGGFPDYTQTLNFFKESFDRKEAEQEGRMVPRPGVDSDYDNILREIEEIEDELKRYRKKQEIYFDCRVNFVGTEKKRFQLEIPEKAVCKADSKYTLEGSRKGFSRFSTRETKEFLSRMMTAEQTKTDVLRDLSRRIFERFTNNYAVWSRAIVTAAISDAIISLTEYARLQPNVTTPAVCYSSKPFIRIKDGVHPCIANSDEFIPNDTELGGEQLAPMVLLSGANMGGKSTLMRQVGLITVMAQIGSLVPASECSLSIVNRVFTRVGARDEIASGSSTFLVEMSEAAAILDNADKNSLVLIDELGRGTSTYDGTALAWAVVSALSKIGCPTIFSTHYHKLSEKATLLENVRLMHMACMVEQDECSDGDSLGEECITFLYKLSDGSCPKSYGFNAAKLAGLPVELVQRARGIALRTQERAEFARACRDIYQANSAEMVQKILQDIHI